MDARKLSLVILIELFALFQGLSFGLFPALSDLLTHAHFHILSVKELYMLFFVLSASATVFAFVAGLLVQRGRKNFTFVGGMVLNILSMLLIALTGLTLEHHLTTLFMLLIALIFLGGGLGTLLVILSGWMVDFFPNRFFVALLFLFATLSFGVTLAGVLIDFSLTLHHWWLAPTLVCGTLIILLLIIDLFIGYPDSIGEENKRFFGWKSLFILIIAFLYGYIESMVGVWVGLYLVQNSGISVHDYEFLFIGFWAIMTLARIAAALLILVLSFKFFYLALPVVIGVAAFYFPSFHWLTALAIAILLPLNLGLMPLSSRLYGANLSAYFLGISGGSLILKFYYPEIKVFLWIMIILLIVLHPLALFIGVTHPQKKSD